MVGDNFQVQSDLVHLLIKYNNKVRNQQKCGPYLQFGHHEYYGPYQSDPQNHMMAQQQSGRNGNPTTLIYYFKRTKYIKLFTAVSRTYLYWYSDNDHAMDSVPSLGLIITVYNNSYKINVSVNTVALYLIKTYQTVCHFKTN